VFVEERQPGNGLHHVSLLVHHDDGCSTPPAGRASTG
jgi:hypothetical protein